MSYRTGVYNSCPGTGNFPSGLLFTLTQVFFEAPPSSKVYFEMERYIEWFNSYKKTDSILEKAAIAHLYFENIHPFEDGNGRIGRAIIEKSLSQGVEGILSSARILQSHA